MKAIRLFLSAILCLSLAVVSCSKAPESMTISPEIQEITEGESVQLTAKVSPAEAKYEAIKWSSDNESIATVNNNGLVTGVGVGTAIITAKTESVVAYSTIFVRAKVINVTDISLNLNTAELMEGESVVLEATIAPDNATDKSFTWKSSDEAVATVSTEGKVTAVKAGKATISATTTDGNKTASCELVVTDLSDGIQLWANGPYWAAYNIGATSPEEIGDFYAWGETTKRYSSITDMGGGFGMIEYNDPDVMFNEYNTPFVAPDGETILKYDGKDYSELLPEDDVATVVLGGEWCMPTIEEFVALIENTDYEFVADYNGTGVGGWSFTGKDSFSGRSIFLPFTGESIWEMWMNGESVGRYWSKTVWEYDPADYEGEGFIPMPGAWSLGIYDPNVFKDSSISTDEVNNRCLGSGIRPVRHPASAK